MRAFERSRKETETHLPVQGWPGAVPLPSNGVWPVGEQGLAFPLLAPEPSGKARRGGPGSQCVPLLSLSQMLARGCVSSLRPCDGCLLSPPRYFPEKLGCS